MSDDRIIFLTLLTSAVFLYLADLLSIDLMVSLVTVSHVRRVYSVIPGQSVVKSEQAPASSRSAKNQFNIDVPGCGHLNRYYVALILAKIINLRTDTDRRT